MTDSTPSIVVEELQREFGGIRALNGLNLSIDEPLLVGVAGPNGSGKTTLIRSLLGHLRPTKGTIYVNGTDPLEFTSKERGTIGYMPQHEAVYRDLTVEENVQFFASLYRVDNKASAVTEALDFVDLLDRRDAKISELSGGMIRRTSLACAIVHQPKLLFLDEPTVGLDPALREEMWHGFESRRDSGTLALVSTHYLGEVRHCDRVLFLRNGRVLAFESPSDFMDSTGTDNLEDAFNAILELESEDRQLSTPDEEASA